MNLSYHRSESVDKPLEIEVGVTTAYFRKDIRLTEMKNDDGNIYTMWVYQEATVPKEDFNGVMNQFLLEQQRVSTSDQMTIMEAIADLYETIATLM